MNETTSTSTTIRGPSSSAVGLDHDEDIIWVWLNPVVSFTINSATNFTWTGYGFDQNDPAGTTDVLGIPVKFLNGHAAMPCLSLMCWPDAGRRARCAPLRTRLAALTAPRTRGWMRLTWRPSYRPIHFQILLCDQHSCGRQLHVRCGASAAPPTRTCSIRRLRRAASPSRRPTRLAPSGHLRRQDGRLRTR